MTEMPKPVPEQLPLPEATPDTLHDVAMDAWQNNLDAVRDDELPFGGRSLRLYPTKDPRDSVLIFPVMGSESMEEGTFRMLRTKGSRTTDLLDIMTTGKGERIVSSLESSDLPGALELAPLKKEAISRMQHAIVEASPNRPPGKFARMLGRTAARSAE